MSAPGWWLAAGAAVAITGLLWTARPRNERTYLAAVVTLTAVIAVGWLLGLVQAWDAIQARRRRRNPPNLQAKPR